MSRATARKSGGGLENTLARVRQGERVILRRGKRAVAAIVPIKDLRRLQELEDRQDVEEAVRRLADPAEVPVPYDKVRKELGLG